MLDHKDSIAQKKPLSGSKSDTVRTYCYTGILTVQCVSILATKHMSSEILNQREFRSQGSSYQIQIVLHNLHIYGELHFTLLHRTGRVSLYLDLTTSIYSNPIRLVHWTISEIPLSAYSSNTCTRRRRTTRQGVDDWADAREVPARGTR